MFFEPLKNLATKIKELDSDKLFVSVISRKGISTFIADLNRSQLLKGEGSDDNSLMKYIDDPFFNSIEQARAYQRWKENISPNKSKSVEVMDFYINGYFHRSIFTSVQDDFFQLKSNASFADSIDSKEPDALGLTTENKDLLVEITTPLMLEELRKELLK
jgi:hypothetical protein